MTNMDITALGAAPAPDATCASADTPADAAEDFAALLDEATGSTGDSLESSSVPVKDGADEDDEFDELAALAMTSLLSLVAPAVTPDPVDEEQIAAAIELTEGDAIAGVTAAATLIDVSIESQPTPIAPDTGSADDASESAPADDPAMTPEWNAKVGAAASEPKVATIPASEAPPEIADRQNVDAVRGETTSLATKASTDTAPATKPARGSKPSRNENVKAAHTAAVHANVARAIAAASQQPTSETRIAARGESPAEMPAPASIAARFARALERAAAMTGNEPATAATATAGASSGSGRQSSSGDESAEGAMPFVTTPRHTGGGVSFTVAAPTAIDVRTLAHSVNAASRAVETTPTTILERDVVAQLVQSMRVQFRDGIGEAVVKLKPEHLGSVQISLKIENGAIKATVQAEVASVRQWLESQQDTLKTSLAEQGLRLERFVVERPVVDSEGERRQASADDAQQREHPRRKNLRPRANAAMSEKDQPIFDVTV